MIGSGNSIGGICGYNEGALISFCFNHSKVSGEDLVGGIVGYSRSYTKNGVNSYILACGSSEKASVKASQSNSFNVAGGIIGYLLNHKAHTNSQVYIVACYSLSDVSAPYPGSMVGEANGDQHGLLISSFAYKRELSNVAGHNYSSFINSGLFQSNHYSVSTDISEDVIAKMNEEITKYNDQIKDIHSPAVTETIKCHYKWKFNSSGWPTLEKVN